MQLITIMILGMGMMGSAVVKAQEAGQGSAVPRQPVLVAQAGTPPPPGSPVVAAASAAPSMLVPVLIGVGIVAAVAASGSSSSTNH
jgi:hypothetical protein